MSYAISLWSNEVIVSHPTSENEEVIISHPTSVNEKVISPPPNIQTHNQDNLPTTSSSCSNTP